MQIIDPDSWGAFVTEIEKLKTKYGSRNVLGRDERNVILYRGQAKAKWKLQTTLERSSVRKWTAS